MIKASLEAVRSVLRDLRDYCFFRRNGANYKYRGLYHSYNAAVAALPSSRLKGFDHQSVAEFFAATHFVFNNSDYPILFWLSRILESGQTVFDFGGGVGQCFYLYQKFLQFPACTRWVVCDVQALAECGARLAEERNAKGLTFTTDFSQARDAEILFTAGALHYLEPDLPALLSGLPRLPKHVLVQRVPMYDGATYFTVQHSEHSFLAHKVMNTRDFIAGMENLSYETIDQWALPRSIRVPFHPQHFVPNFQGFYFRRRDN